MLLDLTAEGIVQVLILGMSGRVEMVLERRLIRRLARTRQNTLGRELGYM
jgi:hypothetical protein